MKRIGVFLAAILLAASVYAADDDLAAPAPSPFAKGTVEKIDPVTKLLVIRTGTGPREFYWTDRTYVFRGKEKISPTKLQQNELIALRFTRGPGGEWLIVRIKAYGAESQL